jgi:transcriptional regulator with XRE-family HTH domain
LTWGAVMSLGERIRQTRLDKRLSQRVLSKRLGLTRHAISMWETDKASPSSAHLGQLAVEFDVDLNWLSTGRGSKDGNKAQGLPVRGTVATGVWREPTEMPPPEVFPATPDRRYPSDAQYLLRVEGAGMDKIAPAGSLVHCVDLQSTGMQIQHGDVVVVERRRHGMRETTLRRVQQAAAEGLKLHSEGGEHQSVLELDGSDQVVVKALVIYAIRAVSRAG